MNKVLKRINTITTILIILIASLVLTGCVSGIVSEEQYTEIFDGVEAQDEDGNSVYYQMKTLVDNTQFNTNIQSKPYCKLDIYLKQSCQIRGVVFIVRSSENCTLKFTTYIDGEIKTTKTKDITSGAQCDIDMFFSEACNCNTRSDFYIQIEEQNKMKDEEKTDFQFDSLVIFLEE